jgi:hypothetical protein
VNRRGNFFDSFAIIITIFTIGILCFIGVLFVNQFTDGITGTTGLPTEATAIATSVDDDIGWVLDFFVMMMLMAMPIGSMLLAFFNNIHPLFFWASIGLTMLVVIVGAAFGDAFTAMINTDTFSGVVGQLPMSTWVFNNFGMYSLFVVLIIAAGVFVKSRSGGYSQ